VLVHSRKRADVGLVPYRHVPAQRRAVAQHGAVAHLYIVGDVDIRHQQIVVADAGQHASAFGAAMDGHELADSVAAADARCGSFALVLQVLRRHADRAVGVKNIIFADCGGAFQVYVGHQASACSDLDLRSHDAVGADLRGSRYTCRGVDEGCRMERHYSGLAASLHVTSASAPSTAAMVTSPVIV